MSWTLKKFIARRGASLFVVGLIGTVYFYIVDQYVSYLTTGMIILGIILIGLIDEEEKDEIDYSEYERDM